MKDSKKKSKSSKNQNHFDLDFITAGVYYGIVVRGKILGGKKSPNLYTKDEVYDEAAVFIRDRVKIKVVKIRLTYTVISEVIL